VEPNRPLTAIETALKIIKNTKTHSELVIFIAYIYRCENGYANTPQCYGLLIWPLRFFLLPFAVAKRRDISLKCASYWLCLSTDSHISQSSHILTFNSVSSAGLELKKAYQFHCQSQWPRGLRRRSAAARLLRLRVRIPPGMWMSVYCECCVSSGRDLCVGLITSPEESHRLRCVVMCDLETS